MTSVNEIGERLSKYLTDNNIGLNDMGRRSQTSGAQVSNIINGKVYGIDKLFKILNVLPKEDSEWILSGQKMIRENDKVNDKVITKNAPLIVNEPQELYQSQSQSSKVNTILVDYKDNELIPITDIRAAAGNGHIEEGFIDATEAILLPQHLLKRSGTRICIRVKGESMAPTLHDASYLIISLIERSEWPLLKENNVYVVADNDGKVYVKRLKNRFNREKPFIVCQSDSPDKASYPNFNLYSDEILSIWYAEWYISAKMPNIHDNFYGKVTQLEDSIESLTEDFQKMQSEIKQLKKPDN
jgi:phage repressor protein C with HTH and peptisase S24 domain